MNKWLSVNDAAKDLGLGRSAVYALVASKELACYRVGPNRGRLRFKPEDIEAYIQAGRSGPKATKAPAPPKRPAYVPLDDLSGPFRPR